MSDFLAFDLDSPEGALPKERVQRILEAARKLFTHYGFEKTTMDDIAREVGVSKGTLYLDFESKERVLQAMLDAHLAQTFVWMKAQVQAAKPPYLAAIETIYVEHILRVFNDALQMFHSPELMLMAREQMKETLIRYLKKKDEFFGSLLQKAAENKEIKPQRHYAESFRIISLALASFFPPYHPSINLLTDNEEAIKRDATRVIRLILAGLKESDPCI